MNVSQESALLIDSVTTFDGHSNNNQIFQYATFLTTCASGDTQRCIRQQTQKCHNL